MSPALPRPLSPTGKRSARWVQWQQRQYAVVFVRCRGRCEVSDCRRAAHDPHHVFGRRQLSEPLSSCSELLVGVCRPCHTEITDGRLPEVNQQLQTVALLRAAKRWPMLTSDVPEDLRDRALLLERTLKASDEWQKLLADAGL